MSPCSRLVDSGFRQNAEGIWSRTPHRAIRPVHPQRAYV